MVASPIGSGRLGRALRFACAFAGALGALAAAGRAAASGAPATLISRSPFGLSVEYPLLERALGPGPCPGRALVDTFRELGSPSLRIGGDSQDLAGPSSAYHYFIPSTFWAVLGCFARETNAQITVGLNFGDGTLADNRTMIAAAERAIPAAQLSFSLGNEPDLYGSSHVLPNGFTVPIFRHGPWSASIYARQWRRRRALLGAIRLEGPDLAGNDWRVPIAALLHSDPPNQIDAHAYPASACPIGPRGTPQRLLSRRASIGLVQRLGWLLAAARAAHRPAVISESNSASCGGEPNVSNSPVASVWAVRFTMAALLAGFRQVRFHSAGTSYDPFVFKPDGTIARRPLAHALSFLRRWIPIDSRIAAAREGSRVFAMRVAHDGKTSMIVSSFASRTLDLSIPIAGSSEDLMTDTLTTARAGGAQAPQRVLGHRLQLKLAPDTVVAFTTS